MKINRAGWIILLPLLFGVMPLGAQSSPSQVDYAAIKKDLAVFESVIDTTIKQNVTGYFPILAATQGAYLPQYGAIFMVEINLFQIRTISPFSPQPHSQKELDEAYALMIKKVAVVKEALVKAIGDYGASQQQLMPEQSLTVVVNLFNADRQIKQPVPAQLIFTAKQALITEYREKRLPLAEFAKRMEMVQF